MEDSITQAKTEFSRAKDRISRALATTPDERINWSPSATSRTPIQEVAHAAMAIDVFGGILAGRPHHFRGILEEERAMREAESRFTDRAEVLELLERNSSAYLAWLEGLPADQLAEVVELPFGVLPLGMCVAMLSDHLRGHAAQIDYIQTVYGDLDWHMDL